MGSKFKILCLQETSWNSLRTAPRDLRSRMGKALGALWASAHQQVNGQQPRQNFGTGILTRLLSAFAYENFGVRVGYGTIGEEIRIDSLTTAATHGGGGGGGGGGGHRFTAERTVLRLVISDVDETGDEICDSIISHIILENLDIISTWIASDFLSEDQEGLIITGAGRSIYISALRVDRDGDAGINHCFLLAEPTIGSEELHRFFVWGVVFEVVQHENDHVGDISHVSESSSVAVGSPVQVRIRYERPFSVMDSSADFVMRGSWSLSAWLRRHDFCTPVESTSSALRRPFAWIGLTRSLKTRRVSAFELLSQCALAGDYGADFVMRGSWSLSAWLRRHCLSQAAIEQAELWQPESYEDRIKKVSRRLRKQFDVVPADLRLLRPLFCAPKPVGTQAFTLLVRCASLGNIQGVDDGNGLARSTQDMVTSG